MTQKIMKIISKEVSRIATSLHCVSHIMLNNGGARTDL